MRTARPKGIGQTIIATEKKMSPNNKPMYLKHIHIENFGPLERIDFDMPFSEGSGDATPIPLVLVGKNGAGKTVFIAQIVDALIEIQKKVYDNIVFRQGLVEPFFLILGGTNIKIGKESSLTFATFTNGISYVAHSGDINRINDFSTMKSNYSFLARLSSDNFKYLDFMGSNGCSQETKDALEQCFSSGIYSFFPASRTEPPFWLNNHSLINLNEGFSFVGNIRGNNEKNILCETIFNENIKWLFDVLVDSNVSSEYTLSVPEFSDPFAKEKKKNRGLVKEVEKIFSIILSNKIKLVAALRHAKARRLQIFDADKNDVLIDNLAKLSLGQKILLNIFLTIVRYGDNGELDDFCKLKGIVTIDEIDSHLHIEFQKNILPQLIRLFPGIQFIVTTHSPFFIMGMTEACNDFRLMELPCGNIIQHDEFSEIQEATKIFFPAYEQTHTQLEKLKEQIARQTRPVVLTEGRSDAIILHNAWNKLYPGLAQPFEIIPSGYQADVSKRTGGAKEINFALARISTCDFPNKIVGLFDNDHEGNGQFRGLQSESFEPYNEHNPIRKHLKYDIWGMLLPVPQSRKEKYEGVAVNQRRFVIELYFKDGILISENMLGEEIARNTGIYEITKNSSKKIDFANKTASFLKEDFADFQILFDELLKLLSITGNILVPSNIHSSVYISIDNQNSFTNNQQL